MMTISRRQFFTLFSAALGAAAAPALLQLIGSHLANTSQVPPPLELDQLGTGTLSSDSLETLVALAEVFAQEWGTIDHYTDYYTWRAENLPGYHAIYTDFAARINTYTLHNYHCLFTDCPTQQRWAALQLSLDAARPDDLTLLPVDILVARGISTADALWTIYNRYIIAETLHLFTLTNGQLMLGYMSWPGQPDGLTHYTQAIQQT